MGRIIESASERESREKAAGYQEFLNSVEKGLELEGSGIYSDVDVYNKMEVAVMGAKATSEVDLLHMPLSVLKDRMVAALMRVGGYEGPILITSPAADLWGVALEEEGRAGNGYVIAQNSGDSLAAKSAGSRLDYYRGVIDAAAVFTRDGSLGNCSLGLAISSRRRKKEQQEQRQALAVASGRYSVGTGNVDAGESKI